LASSGIQTDFKRFGSANGTRSSVCSDVSRITLASIHSIAARRRRAVARARRAGGGIRLELGEVHLLAIVLVKEYILSGQLAVKVLDMRSVKRGALRG